MQQRQSLKCSKPNNNILPNPPWSLILIDIIFCMISAWKFFNQIECSDHFTLRTPTHVSVPRIMIDIKLA